MESKTEQTEDDPASRPLRLTIDPSGTSTNDKTVVDIITVPCPGGHPLRTWSRDGLLSRYFGAPSMRDAEAAARKGNVSSSSSSESGSSNGSGSGSGSGGGSVSWVRQGVRREVSEARILLYEHPAVGEGATLEGLTEELLSELGEFRRREEKEKERGLGVKREERKGDGRPVVFVAHSLGGIVVKMALGRARSEMKWKSIWRDCYGVAFFGTLDHHLESPCNSY